MASIIIAPKKGENPLLKGAKKMYKKLGDGEIMNMEGGKEVGEWNSQVLPLTSQGRRIRWSAGKKRYLLLDENNQELPQEELDALVKRSYLTYEDGVDKGKVITSADPRNWKDPFFNHGSLAILLREDNGKLDKDDSAKDTLLVYGLRASDDVATSKDALTSGKIRYIMSDKGEEKNTAIEEMKSERLAGQLLDNLSDSKRLIVAKIMGLGVNNTSDRETVDLALYNAIKNNQKKNSEGITLRQLFIRICSMKSEELNLRYLIAQARDSRIIKQTKAGFSFNGTRIASTDVGLYEYFRKLENQEVLMSLETAMGRVTSITDDQSDETTG